MAPRHWLFDIWASLKSSEEMVHDWPPKEIATLTVVEQAIYSNFVNALHYDGRQVGYAR